MSWVSKTVKKAVKSVGKTFKAAGHILTGKANSSDWLRLGGTALGAVGGVYGGNLLGNALARYAGANMGTALGSAAGTAATQLGATGFASGTLAGTLGSAAAGAYLGKEMGKGVAAATGKKPANLDTSGSDDVSGITAESGTGAGKDYEARRKAGYHYGKTLLS